MRALHIGYPLVAAVTFFTAARGYPLRVAVSGSKLSGSKVVAVSGSKVARPHDVMSMEVIG